MTKLAVITVTILSFASQAYCSPLIVQITGDSFYIGPGAPDPNGPFPSTLTMTFESETTVDVVYDSPTSPLGTLVRRRLSWVAMDEFDRRGFLSTNQDTELKLVGGQGGGFLDDISQITGVEVRHWDSFDTMFDTALTFNFTGTPEIVPEPEVLRFLPLAAIVACLIAGRRRSRP